MSVNSQIAAHQQHKTLHKTQSFASSAATLRGNVSQKRLVSDTGKSRYE